MPTTNEVQVRNKELARRIHEEALSHPDSQYAGKFVGIANGRVVAVADSLDEAARKLRGVEHDAAKCYCFEAGADYDSIQEIWKFS